MDKYQVGPQKDGIQDRTKYFHRFILSFALAY